MSVVFLLLTIFMLTFVVLGTLLLLLSLTWGMIAYVVRALKLNDKGI